MSPPLTTSSTPLRGAFTVLSEYPRMGRSRDDLRPGLRSFAVGQYVIVYAIEEENVLILHVFHGRQDIEGQLGYWRRGSYAAALGPRKVVRGRARAIKPPNFGKPGPLACCPPILNKKARGH
jgi:hypothetical protein